MGYARYGRLVAAATALFLAPVAPAETIFHWVDGDGILHFSDTAPTSTGEDVITLTVHETTPANYDPREDRYSILDQAARMSARLDAIRERRAAEPRAFDREAEDASDVEAYRRHVSPYRYAWPLAWRAPALHRPELAARQSARLGELGLDPLARPHSINSSTHRQRVAASRAAATNDER